VRVLRLRTSQTRTANKTTQPTAPTLRLGGGLRFVSCIEGTPDFKNRRLRRVNTDFRPFWCSLWENDPRVNKNAPCIIEVTIPHFGAYTNTEMQVCAGVMGRYSACPCYLRRRFFAGAANELDALKRQG